MDAYEREFGENHTKTAWILVHLGSVYRSIGYPNKAKDYLLRGVKTYKHQRGKNSFEYAWSTAHLSAVYRDLGDLDKPIELLNESLDFYNNHLEENHVLQGWIKYHLGSAYRLKGDKKKAKKLLQESLIINETHYGKNHITAARILNSLSKIGIVNRSFAESRGYLERALKIYIANNNHFDRYKAYESMGDLYNEMSKSGEGSAFTRQKSLDNFRKAMNIVEESVPADSVQIIRIKSKIEDLEA